MTLQHCPDESIDGKKNIYENYKQIIYYVCTAYSTVFICGWILKKGPIQKRKLPQLKQSKNGHVHNQYPLYSMLRFFGFLVSFPKYLLRYHSPSPSLNLCVSLYIFTPIYIVCLIREMCRDGIIQVVTHSVNNINTLMGLS